MKENVNKLMELMKTDEALRGRLCEAKDKDAVIAIAAERGIVLTDADFEVSEEEKQRLLAQKEQVLHDDELEAVVGAGRGNGGCGCALVGGGGGTDVFCACVIAGQGSRTDVTFCCICVMTGFGKH